VEITRRTRAQFFAALVATGSAAHARGQSPDATVNVDAPRPPAAVVMSPLSVIPDATQTAAFRVNGTTGPVAGQLEKMPAGDAPPAASLGPPPAAGMPAGPALPPPPAPPLPTTGPMLPPPPPNGPPHPIVPAPLWRWHGYGGVKPTEQVQPMAFSPVPPANVPAPGEPRANTVTPTSATQSTPEWRPALPGPGYPSEVGRTTTSVDAVPLPPIPSSPVTSGIEQTAAVVRSPGMIVTACVTGATWGSPAATLDAPRPAGTYMPSTVCPTLIQPASYTVPASFPRPAQPMSLGPVRASIERACTGRGRDIELVPEGPSTLLVRLKVRQVADAQYLANLISRLPELASFKVIYEMQVAG
jgi:hypothetical protein